MIGTYEPVRVQHGRQRRMGQGHAPISDVEGGLIAQGHIVQPPGIGYTKSLLVALAGGGMTYGATLIPHAKVAQAGTVVGVVIAGYGVYSFVQALTSDEVPGPQVSTQTIPPQNPEDVRQIMGAIVEPGAGGFAERPAFESYYPIKFRITNPTNRALTLSVDYRTEEFPKIIGASSKNARSYIVDLGPNETKTVSDATFPISFMLFYSIKVKAQLWMKASAQEPERLLQEIEYWYD